MSHYRYHVFFCVNERTDGRECCAQHDSQRLRDYAKKKIKSLALNGPGGVRINTAGCLDRCELGPVMVVYPEAVWYTFVDEEDIDEIIRQHLQNGEIVDRLRVDGE